MKRNLSRIEMRYRPPIALLLRAALGLGAATRLRMLASPAAFRRQGEAFSWGLYPCPVLQH